MRRDQKSDWSIVYVKRRGGAVKLWKAQIGLAKRVRQEYYGYVEVRDFDPRVLELPNPLLFMYFSKNREEASEFFETMARDRDEILAKSKLDFETASIADGDRDRARSIVESTFTEEFLESADHEYLINAFLMGLHLGRGDALRIGEQPPVAVGVHKEAADQLARDLATGDESNDSAVSISVKRGFFLARAVG